jgi:hypothetical protein
MGSEMLRRDCAGGGSSLVGGGRRLRRVAVAGAGALVLLAAGTLIGATLGGAGPTSKWTFRGNNNFSRWEYAEFTLLPDRAVVVGDTAVQEIVPPRRLEDRDTVFENDAGKFIERFDLRLYYINVMGAEGWQFPEAEPVREGKTYLVRRQRR